MEEKSKRIEWLDSCKGFAIILVVLGHLFRGYREAGLFNEYESLMITVDNLIYSFHMPLFFTLSGYVFCRAYCIGKSEKSKLKMSIMNNIYIYILFSCVQWLLKFIFSSAVNSQYTINDLILMPIKPMSPYWYLYVLVFYYIIFYALRNRLSSKKLLIITIIISSISKTMFTLLNINLLFSLGEILTYNAFFALGIYIYREVDSKFLSDKTMYLTLVCTIIIFAVNIIFNVNSFLIPIIGVLSASVITIFFINIFSKCKSIGNFNVFILCGKYSLEIYVTHCFITAASRFLPTKLGLNVFGLDVVLSLIAATFIPVLFGYILKKIKIHRYIFRPFKAINKNF